MFPRRQTTEGIGKVKVCGYYQHLPMILPRLRRSLGGHGDKARGEQTRNEKDEEVDLTGEHNLVSNCQQRPQEMNEK